MTEIARNSTKLLWTRARTACKRVCGRFTVGLARPGRRRYLLKVLKVTALYGLLLLCFGFFVGTVFWAFVTYALPSIGPGSK